MGKTATKNGKGKITIIIGKLIGGGAERVACNLANYLYNKGYSVDVVTTIDTNYTYEIEEGINVSVLLPNSEKKNRLFNIITRQRRLKEYVEKNKDVMCYIAMMPKSSFRIAMLKKRTKAKIIISERNDPLHHTIIDKIMMKYAARRSDGIVVQTEKIKEWYNKNKNVIVIPNAVNKDVLLKRDYPILNKFVAVGKLERQKNYPMLIDAFKIFTVKHPDYFLEIYGSGKLKNQIKERIYEYGLSDKVKLMGYVKDVHGYIANAECFLMTSDYEGIPNALIEAMAIGLPCIMTDCDGGGAKQLIKDEENGLLVEKGAVKEFALAMEKIVEEDSFREKISNNAKKINFELNEEVIYGKWLKFVSEISTRQGGNG